MALTYKTESIVEKIEAPVICVINGVETEYENGAALYAYDFDRNYYVQSISVRGNKVVVTLAERKLKNITWIGEDAVPYADSNSEFAKEYKEKYGEEVSFF